MLDAGTYPGLHEEPPCCSFSNIFKGNKERRARGRRGEREKEHTPGSAGQDGLPSVRSSENSCCRGVARADRRQGPQPEEAHGSCTGGGGGGLAASVSRAGPSSFCLAPLAVARGFLIVGGVRYLLSF